MEKGKRYSDKEKELIIKLYPNTPTICICGLLGRTYLSVRKVAVRNNIRKTPEYKSKLGKKTGFKKNQVSNAKPIGYEKLNGLGYIDIKVKENRFLTLKHRYIYEKHFGKIPNGSIVIFKDKNSLNCDIQNLECITRAENMTRNSNIRYPKPLRKLIQIHSKLKKLINAKSEQLRQTK